MNNQEAGKPLRITVAEAFRQVSEIILSNVDKTRYPDNVALFSSAPLREVWEEEGEPTEAWEEREDGKQIALANLKASFLAFCQAMGTKPRNLHNPWAADSYTGEDGIQDFRHDISYEDFELWSAPYRLPIRHFDGIPRTDQEATSKPTSSAAAKSLSAGLGWKLKPLERVHVLSGIIYDILKAAYVAGRPRPTARDVLDELERNPHADVISVFPDGIKYRSNTETKTADVGMIGKRISRLTFQE
jgi:hypothetical protein